MSAVDDSLRLKVLLSYAHVPLGKKTGMIGKGRTIEYLADRRDLFEVIVDSGAYTAWTTGRTITVDEYAAFLRDMPFKPDHYMTLDVIGEPKASRANYEALLERGLSPIPIVTRGDSYADVDRYFETADMIALGGVTGINNASLAWTRAMMDHIRPRKAHILGMTRLEWVKVFRPWSIDSASWVMNTMAFGSSYVYMGNGSFVNLTGKGRRTKGVPLPIAARIRRYGFDPYELAKKEAQYGGDSLCVRLSTMAWLEYAIEQRAAFGTRLFFCLDAGAWHAKLLIQAMQRLKQVWAGELSNQARADACAPFMAAALNGR